jgi:sodium/potassium-transporting ATPase subunit alpha
VFFPQHCKRSVSSVFFKQLSYQPLGSLNGGTPAIFNLGVAMLLVSLRHDLDAFSLTRDCGKILVIIVSSTFYAVVDWHASRIMKSIKNLVAEETTVIRDGKKQTIDATGVVVGDIVALSMGDRVPADVRIIQASSNLKFDRSLLTGERCFPKIFRLATFCLPKAFL